MECDRPESGRAANERWRAVTTEIAVMNRQGIALAADSAVTIGRERVWKTANKLFSLGPHNDIGIMTFGSGDFLSVPWETIVKTFRARNGANKFSTVKDSADAFVSYIKSGLFKSQRQEQLSILPLFVYQIHKIKRDLNTSYKTKTEFKSKLDDRINISLERVKKDNIFITDFDEKQFMGTYSASIIDLTNDAFKERLPKAMQNKIIQLCYEAFRREVTSLYETGIVVAGFGMDEFFPSVVTYIVDGFDNGRLRAWIDDDYSANLNPPSDSTATIIPFGQDDIAALFLEGIAKSHLRWINRALKTIFDDRSSKLCNSYIKDDDERLVEQGLQKTENREIIRLLNEEFARYRENNLVQKIMGVVESLPKEEMVVLAESLVELTSLRRKMDSKLESVGGPTDVAIISKGDGLIWKNRKHYFDISLNGDYILRKKLQLSLGEDDETGDHAVKLATGSSVSDTSSISAIEPGIRLARRGGRARRQANNQENRRTPQ